MDKVYKISNGKTMSIPVSEEAAFLAELKEKKLTAELIDNPSSNPHETNQSKNNQQSNNK